jgi:hypothetical protein
MEKFAFEHERGFARETSADGLAFGKYQAHYEELFAEVIEDGVITPEERARLNRAAHAMGLDPLNLRRLEEALHAAYEARRGVRAREIDEEQASASLTIAARAPNDIEVAQLRARVAQLEAKVVDLTRQLEKERARAPVEPGPVTPAMPGAEAIEELQRSLRANPRDVATLRALFRAYGDSEGDFDRQWLVAHVLHFLGAAEESERRLYLQGRIDGLIKPTCSVSRDGWKLLFHPDEELLTGQIFGVIVSAVLLGRVSTLRQERALVLLDPAQKQDATMSTLQAVRCFSWAGAVLGIAPPPLYADPEYPETLEMVPGLPPSTRLGQAALAGRSPFELAFLVGRHLSFYREEHFIRLLAPSIVDLENLFLAALVIANASLPLSAEVRARVDPLARAIEPLLETAAVDRLRGHYLRFVEEGGRTNLQRWSNAAEQTAARAGFLLANDLSAAKSIFELEHGATADAKMDDLIVFATGDRCAKLRRQIGIALS